MKRELAPVVLFAYNRPLHTQKVLDALVANVEAKDSLLYIFCDGAKQAASNDVINNINKTRLVANSEKRFKQVIVKEQTSNKGLANSIIDGVTEVVNKFGKIIVVEDDILASPYFLKYMNDALGKYEDENKVACIHAYVYPVKGKLPETFFIKGADCWGWATWKRGWDVFEKDGKKLRHQLQTKQLENEFDFAGTYSYTSMLQQQIDGTNDSWAIRWYASAFLNNQLCLYPAVSLVQNIGNDGSGINSGDSSVFDVKTSHSPVHLKSILVEEDENAKKQFANYFTKLKGKQNPVLSKMKGVVKRLLK